MGLLWRRSAGSSVGRVVFIVRRRVWVPPVRFSLLKCLDERIAREKRLVEVTMAGSDRYCSAQTTVKGEY